MQCLFPSLRLKYTFTLDSQVLGRCSHFSLRRWSVPSQSGVLGPSPRSMAPATVSLPITRRPMCRKGGVDANASQWYSRRPQKTEELIYFQSFQLTCWYAQDKCIDFTLFLIFALPPTTTEHELIFSAELSNVNSPCSFLGLPHAF